MEITIEQILAVLNKTKGKKMADIKKDVRAEIKDDVSLFDNIDKQIQQIINLELKKGDESLIIRKNSKYRLKSATTPPKPIQTIDKQFEGAAGETAVISELLFREFNANRMMVDKGIDVVATKDNVYRYIQVKTSNINSNGRVNWQIKQERYDANVVGKLWYILVARYEERFKYKNQPIARNMFFVLSYDDIERGINQGWINKGVENLSIKVRFDTQTGEPKFYDNKEENTSHYLNSFDRI